MRKLCIFAFFMLGVLACKIGAIPIYATYDRLSGVALEDHVLFQDNVAGSVADIRFNAEGTYTLKRCVPGIERVSGGAWRRDPAHRKRVSRQA